MTRKESALRLVRAEVGKTRSGVSAGRFKLSEDADKLKYEQSIERKIAEAVAAEREAWEPVKVAASELLDALETCHNCKTQILVDETPMHCESCSGDCDDHQEPDCTPIHVLHARLTAAIRARGLSQGRGIGDQKPKREAKPKVSAGRVA